MRGLCKKSDFWKVQNGDLWTFFYHVLSPFFPFELLFSVNRTNFWHHPWFFSLATPWNGYLQVLKKGQRTNNFPQGLLPFNLQFETIYQLTADRIRASMCKYFSLVAIFCTKVFNCSISLNSCAFVRFSRIKMPRDSSRPRKRKFRENQFSQPKEKSPKSELGPVYKEVG